MGKSLDLLNDILKRETAGYGKLKELTDAADLSVNQLSRYMKGETCPSLDTLDAIAVALSKPSWQLIYSDEPVTGLIQNDIIKIIRTMSDEDLGPILKILQKLSD